MVKNKTILVLGLLFYLFVLSIAAKLIYTTSSPGYYPPTLDLCVALVALLIPRLLASKPGSIGR